MKYTVDFIRTGFKPNTRGDFIQDSFTIPEELLEELPDSISFNIEISMLSAVTDASWLVRDKANNVPMKSTPGFMKR